MLLTTLLLLSLVLSNQESTTALEATLQRDAASEVLTISISVTLNEPGPAMLLVHPQSGDAERVRKFHLATEADGTAERSWTIPAHFQQNPSEYLLELVRPGTTTVLASTSITVTPLGTHADAGGPVTLPQSFLYVDGVAGNDSNPGTNQAPWRTIQKAANSAIPGSIVLIAAGIYPERVVVHVSGNATAGMITFRGDAAGGTVLEGNGFHNSDFSNWPGAFGQGLLDITNQSYVRFENLEIRGLTTSSTAYFLMGVQVAKTQGNPNPMSHVELVNLNVHDIRYTGTSDAGGAQGVAFYGGSTVQAITDVLVQGCEIHNLRLGQSESLTINGNVDGFLIADNEVHDNDNIGIDVIGWEGTAGGSVSDDSSNSNAHLYGGHNPVDRGRNGVISGNLVYRCSTDAPVNNPTYPLHDFSAGGIYIDGGHSILIEQNTVYECDGGIELGCEHAGVDDLGVERSTSDIIVRNNEVAYCGQYGIFIGGYNRFRGITVDCQVLNNTVYKSSSLGWGGGQVLFSKCHDNHFANNIFVARGPSDTTDYDGFNNSGGDWRFDHGVVLGSSLNSTYNYNNTLDSNLYYVEGGSNKIYWKWEMTDNQDPIQGFTGVANIDSNAIYGDPGFISSTLSRWQGTEDFRLGSLASPAVDNGDTSLADIGSVDFQGFLRVWNVIVDRGAHEWGSMLP